MELLSILLTQIFLLWWNKSRNNYSCELSRYKRKEKFNTEKEELPLIFIPCKLMDLNLFYCLFEQTDKLHFTVRLLKVTFTSSR